MRLRALVYAALGSMTASCAVLSAPDVPVSARTAAGAPNAGLPEQELTPGACGLFVWTATAPYRLLLFEDESVGRAQVWSAGRALEMAAGRPSSAPAPGLALAREYRHAGTGMVAAVSGRLEAAPEGGQRLASAVLRLREGEGAYTVQPAAGLRVCPAHS